MTQQNSVSTPAGEPTAPAFYVPSDKKPPITGKDRVFAILFLVFGVLFVDLACYGGWNVGFTATTALSFVLMIAYFFREGGRLRLYPLICGGLAVAGSVPFALYNDTDFRVVSVAAILGLMCLFACQITGCNQYSPGSFRCVVDVVLSVLAYPLRYGGNVFRCLKKTAADGGEEQKGNGGKILLGLLCSLPVLAVVLPLLIRSNQSFEDLLTGFSFDTKRLVVSVVVGVILFFFFFSLAFAFKKKLPRTAGVAPTPRKGIDPVIVQTFLSVLSGVYLVYLLTQITYFFSAFGGVLPTAYSEGVADYARRGFFEMCTIAAINLALLFVTMVGIRKKEGKIPLLARVLGTFLCVFTLVLIGTALSKMVLYIDGFGLTRRRVITSVFMIFLVFVFIAAGIRLFVKRFPYMKVVVLSFCLVWLTVGYCDIDTVIARYNVDAYQAGVLETVDVDTIADLSDGAVPYLIELSADRDPEVVRLAHNRLVREFFHTFDVTCGCGKTYCPHEDYDFYIVEETGVNYNRGVWLTDDEVPNITNITPKKEADVRSYNRSQARKQGLLFEHREEILAEINLYGYQW